MQNTPAGTFLATFLFALWLATTSLACPPPPPNPDDETPIDPAILFASVLNVSTTTDNDGEMRVRIDYRTEEFFKGVATPAKFPVLASERYTLEDIITINQKMGDKHLLSVRRSRQNPEYFDYWDGWCGVPFHVLFLSLEERDKQKVLRGLRRYANPENARP